MHSVPSRLRLVVLASVLLPVTSFARDKTCVSPEEAAQKLNKDICISAHIYDVVQLNNGTRFLDICPPELPDAECRFTIVSLWDDRDTVGELNQYRGMNVHLRGTVRSMHGRSGMVLSHARQFKGEPPKFRPNPRLARGFGGDQDRPAVNDPNLGAHGGRRSFMNNRDQVNLSAGR